MNTPFNLLFLSIVQLCIPKMSSPISQDIKTPIISVLSNIGRKSVRISNQHKYLINCKTQGNIPRGIAEQTRFRSSLEDVNFQLTCQNFMDFSASRLLDLFIAYYSKLAQNTRHKYYQKENYYRNQTDDQIFTECMDKVKEKMHNENLKSLKTHESKLLRDKTANITYLATPDPNIQDNIQNNNNIMKVRKRRSKTKKKNRVSTTRLKRKALQGDVPKLGDIPRHEMEKCVINLSKDPDFNLDDNFLYLFYLGLSFSPSPPLPSYSKFEEDIDNWGYKLKWHYKMNTMRHVIDNPTPLPVLKLEQKLIKKSSTTKIEYSGNPALDLYVKCVKTELLNSKCNRRKNNPDNLPKEARQALNTMMKWQDKIIRPFDKGTGVFIIDREDYIQRVLVHLNDTNTFEVISNKNEALDQARTAITEWTDKYKEEPALTEKLTNWLIPNTEAKNKPGNNYINPKAHKPEKDYPGRLISTQCESPTRNLAALTKTELMKIPLEHIITDSNHFNEKIDELNKSKVLLNKTVYHVTLDIVSMYPSIPEELGLKQCKKKLEDRINPLFSTEAIVDAIKITLNHNLTEFNNTIVRQKLGTAMGTDNAPHYADNSISYIDDLIFSDGEDAPRTVPVIWARFRDDVYLPWIGTLEELYDFVKWLNNIHPNIQFTMSTPSTEGTEFLNMFVYTDEEGLIQRKPWSKPCDTHAYVIPTSCHPTHQLQNIPYSIAHRIYNTSSTKQDYENAKLEYIEHIQKRGYNHELVKAAFAKVETKFNNIEPIQDSTLDQEEEPISHNTDPKKDLGPRDRLFPLVTEFNPALPNISRVLKKFEHILDLDKDVSKIINKNNIFSSFRRAPTLQDKLIHSKLPNLPSSSEDVELNTMSQKGCFKCDRASCITCKLYLVETKTFTSYHTETIFNIQHKLSCKSTCLVYIINDHKCHKTYVGCTTNFATRWPNHKSHIKKRKSTCELSTHLNDIEFESVHKIDRSNQTSFDNSLKDCIDVTLIEQVDVSPSDDNTEKLRKCKVREHHWQKELKCMELTGGFNRREERVGEFSR